MTRATVFFFFFLFSACKKENKQQQPPATQQCSNVVISFAVNTQPSDLCTGTGSLQITTTGNGNYTFRLNNGNFQTGNSFQNLLPGNYAVTVKTQEGCTKTDSITISSLNQVPGPLFTEVKNLLNANCLNCHSGNNPQGGLNYTDNCTIVRVWDRIKARAVDGNPSPMPQAGLLPVSERNKILAWINAGHRLTD